MFEWATDNVISMEISSMHASLDVNKNSKLIDHKKSYQRNVFLHTSLSRNFTPSTTHWRRPLLKSSLYCNTPSWLWNQSNNSISIISWNPLRFYSMNFRGRKRVTVFHTSWIKYHLGYCLGVRFKYIILLFV